MPGLLELLSRGFPALPFGVAQAAQRLPQMAQDAWSAATLPRDVYQGRIDPLSPESIARANSLASLMVGTPGTPMGALGSSLRRESFNWPVATLSGKTVDMPIIVNPSRGDITRTLETAPHGDVRALKAPTGDVYLWPANEAMHRDIATTFDLPFKTLNDLQKQSYLFNKADVEKLGAFKNFDDLVGRLSSAAE